MNHLLSAVEKLLADYHVIPKSDPTPGKLCCSQCGRPLHRFDRFTITAVKHRSCTDPKLVGQTSLPSEGQIDG